MLPVVLTAMGSILLIIASVVGAVSNTALVLVLLQGIVGAYGLGFAIYLYRKVRRSGDSDA